MDTDFDAVQANWRAKSFHVAERLSDIPGLRIELLEAQPELEEPDSNHARTEIHFTPGWTGPTRDEVIRMLEEGEPGIRVRAMSYSDSIIFIPVNVRDGEEEVVARRLKEILT